MATLAGDSFTSTWSTPRQGEPQNQTARVVPSADGTALIHDVARPFCSPGVGLTIFGRGVDGLLEPGGMVVDTEPSEPPPAATGDAQAAAKTAATSSRGRVRLLTRL